MIAKKTVGNNWRCPKNCRLVRNINLARKFNKFTDVTFIVGKDGDSCIIKAHRAVVGTVNRELATLLLNKEHWIRIDDVSPIGFKNLIRYVYDTNVKFTNLESVRETHRVAEKYKVHKLKLAAENCLHRAVKYEPTLEMLDIAIEFKMPQLQWMCIDIISTKYQDVLKSKELNSATFKVLEKILTTRPCETDDCQYQALLTIGKWTGNHQVEKKELQDLLKSLDFTRISVQNFLSFVEENDGLLSGDDVRAFQKYILSKEIGDAPKWYQSKTNSDKKDNITSIKELSENNTLKMRFSEYMRVQKSMMQKVLDEELLYIEKLMTDACNISMERHKVSLMETVETIKDLFAEVLKEAVETSIECIEDDMNYEVQMRMKADEKNEKITDENETINTCTGIVSKVEMDTLSKTGCCNTEDRSTEPKFSKSEDPTKSVEDDMDCSANCLKNAKKTLQTQMKGKKKESIDASIVVAPQSEMDSD